MSIENDFFSAVDSANFGYEIAWPGVDFTPPDEGVWLEPIVIRGYGIDEGLPLDSIYMPNGTFRVGVCSRPGGGVVALVGVAQTIAATLVKGTRFADGSFIVNHPKLQTPIIQPDKITVPVTMAYGM
jgi:hypothetical protein